MLDIHLVLQSNLVLTLEPYNFHPLLPQGTPTGPTLQPLSPPPLSLFNSLIDLPDLWVPPGRQLSTKEEVGVASSSSHREWITKLVTTLINSGGVSNEVLLLLKPVCQVKVSN